MPRLLLSCLLCLLCLGRCAGAGPPLRAGGWDYREAMRAVAARFTGKEGVVLHVGDSITYANPYSQWARYGQGKKPVDVAICKWMHTGAGNDLDGWHLCSVDRPGGRSETAAGGIRSDEMLAGSRAGLPALDKMLKKYNPQMVVLMLGTNDASAGRTVEDYGKDMRRTVDVILANGTIAILSTIPPHPGRIKLAEEYNAALRRLCKDKQTPLIDYDAEIRKRRPNDWNGTLLGKNDVHPTASRARATPASAPTAENLRNSGYLLRGWLSVQKIAEVKERVLDPARGQGELDRSARLRVQGPSTSAAVPDLGTRKKGVDWPCFLGPTGDSISPEKGILSPWPKKGLRLVWQKAVGIGYGMPAVSRGRLFQFDRHEDRARLTCLKSETGAPLWKFEYPTDYKDKYNYNGGPRCCPVVDGDRVYIYGAEGMLHCLRVTDGKVLWKVDTKADFGVVQNFFGVGSTPVVEGDLLIAQVGGSPPGSDTEDFAKIKGNGSGVVAFDKRTGKVRYRITDELASYSSPVLTTINGRRWCFVLARGGLIGFEPAAGKVDFHFPWRAPDLESVNASNPVVIGDRVFISETYGPGAALLQVQPGACKVLWSDVDKAPRDKSMQCHWMTPIYQDGYLYGSSGRHEFNAELRCIELATGKVQWGQRRLKRTSLLLVDGHFICLTEDGVVLLCKVNPKKLEPVSIMELTQEGADEPLLVNPCWAAPIVAHGLLYLRGRDRLVCLELIPEGK